MSFLSAPNPVAFGGIKNPVEAFRAVIGMNSSAAVQALRSQGLNVEILWDNNRPLFSAVLGRYRPGDVVCVLIVHGGVVLDAIPQFIIK